MDQALSNYLAGSVRIVTDEGLVHVPCAEFTAEDFATALSRAKKAYKPNKSRSYVLTMLEQWIAEAALERRGTTQGWPVDPLDGVAEK